jgi:hypothetical protein
MLLPPTAQSIRAQSLRGHLALEALRAGSGNGHLLSELIHVLYVAGYLQEAGFGAADAALYAQAEQVLERSAARATAENIWRLDDAEALALERLLTLHDEQLQQNPVNAMREAHKRLVRFTQSSRSRHGPASAIEQNHPATRTRKHRTPHTAAPCDGTERTARLRKKMTPLS